MSARRERGFTLLEILVALVVLGFIIVGLEQGSRFGYAAWRTQARVIDRDGALDAVDRAVRGLIARMEPGLDKRKPAIVGSATHLAFTTTLPLFAGPLTRRADVALFVDEAHRLVLRWTPHLHAKWIGAPPPPVSSVLLTGVTSVAFSYYPVNGPAWLPAWAASEPPALVRVHLAFPPGDARRWPDVIVAPRRQSLQP